MGVVAVICVEGEERFAVLLKVLCIFTFGYMSAKTPFAIQFLISRRVVLMQQINRLRFSR